MSTSSLYSRLIRRETHSPRSMLAIILAIVLIVVFAWVGAEIVIALLGLPALLVAPKDMFASALGLVALPTGTVATAGIALAVIGIILMIAAISPGRRARHALATDRAAIVVDNEVIASALARHASSAGNVDPDNAHVSVSHRRAEIDLTPASGRRIDEGHVAEAVARELEKYGLQPAVRATVTIAEKAEVGA